MITDKAHAAAGHAPDLLEAPEPVSAQPKEVTGNLREYQMLGLAWLVKCFDHGINTILADEMVRGGDFIYRVTVGRRFS